MPRAKRRIEAGMVYHVLNRGNGRRKLFTKEADFLAFGRVLAQGLAKYPVDLLAYCVMGNHWHLLLRPRTDRSLSALLGWVTVTHARRHHAHRPVPGSGHVYQGRFKSFPVQTDAHFLAVARYLHANPVRASLVERAEEWRWSDLVGNGLSLPMTRWPIDRPRGWLRHVNESMTEAERTGIERSIERGTPFGGPDWVKWIAKRLNLEGTLHPLGRPKQPLASLSPRYRKRRERRETHMSG